MKRTALHCLWRCVATGALLFGPASALPGQEPPRAPAGAELQQRLAELDREIEAERALTERLAAAHEAERRRLQEERAEVAGQVVRLGIEAERASRALAALEPEVAALEAAAKQTRALLENLKDAAAATAERIAIHFSELPGHDEAAARARDLAAEVRAAASLQDLRPALQRLLTDLTGAAREASSALVRRTEIFTATGEREPVRLLVLGSVAFAYVTDRDARVGVALASPAEASGYRWSEDLDPEAASLVRDAVDAVASGQARSVRFPIDASGRLPPDFLTRSASLAERWEAGGPVMFPLAFVALLALALVVERAVALFVRDRDGSRVAAEVLAACRSRDLHAARGIARRAGGTVGRVLAACLDRADRGQHAMEDGIQEQLMQEVPRLHRGLGGIAILASVAPLLGLLGTVTGIIHAFEVVKLLGSSDPALMAGGISEALITTAVGLTIAIPVLMIHALLRGRAQRILANAEKHAATLLVALAHDLAHAQPVQEEEEALNA
ncbi:MAG TPA: MotA/TolQ/ExbB proton channel family protein [Planctomycetota bacterium]|nr:MotA/TolQ/ExbB proton channel family protein [Planctomycetota bacterium]